MMRGAWGALEWRIRSRLSRAPCSPMSASASLRPIDWLASAPFTLTLSSGFFGFYAHAGFVAALDEVGLAPARVTGSSAGALIGACHATGLGTEATLAMLRSLRREDFWDPRPGRGLLRGERLHRFLEDRLPVTTFDATRVPIAVSAWNTRTRSTDVLDAGDLLAAARASAAFPLLFQPVAVGDANYLDGGIADRPGLAPVAPGERTLYHHLRSESPWRRRGSASTRVGAREGVLQVCIGGLPRLGPFRMEEGPRTAELARERTRRWLTTGAIDDDAAFTILPALGPAA